MPAAYSLDLRNKAVAAFDNGASKSHVYRLFGISRNTLDLWLKRRERTGALAPDTEYHHGPKPKIDDLDAFREFAKKHGHLTQEEMAQQWSTPISSTTIGLALRKIEFTRKKNMPLSRAK